MNVKEERWNQQVKLWYLFHPYDSRNHFKHLQELCWTMEDLSLAFREEDEREQRVICVSSHAYYHMQFMSKWLTVWTITYTFTYTFGQFGNRLISKGILSNEKIIESYLKKLCQITGPILSAEVRN